MDEIKRDKKRKDVSGKLGREMIERRDECVYPILLFTLLSDASNSGRQYNEMIANLHSTAQTLATRPESLPLYNIMLYPLAVERNAQLASLEYEERYGLDLATTAFEEEREKVELEWKRGHDRIRERLLESIEERRRRARDDKEGEGTVAGASQTLPFSRFYSCFLQTVPSILSRALILHGNCATKWAHRRRARLSQRRPKDRQASARCRSPLVRSSIRTRWSSTSFRPPSRCPSHLPLYPTRRMAMAARALDGAARRIAAPTRVKPSVGLARVWRGSHPARTLKWRPTWAKSAAETRGDE